MDTEFGENPTSRFQVILEQTDKQAPKLKFTWIVIVLYEKDKKTQYYDFWKFYFIIYGNKNICRKYVAINMICRSKQTFAQLNPICTIS